MAIGRGDGAGAPTEPPGGGVSAGLSRGALWRRMAWLAPLALVLFGGGLWLSGALLAAPSLDLLGLTAVWLLTAAILLVGAVDLLRVARLRGAVVRIDADGVLDRRIQTRPLPWSAVRRVEIRTVEGRPVILGLFTPRPREVLRPVPFYGYFGLVAFVRLLAAPFRFAPISIDLETLDTPPERILAAVEALWGAVERRPFGREAGAEDA